MRWDDPDETEGRKLYRGRANALARAQISYGERAVHLRGVTFEDHVAALDRCLAAWELMQRGTGRTTLQMERAPLYAVFVWYGSTDWAKRYARQLHRDDLETISLDRLDARCGVDWVRGRYLTGVVLDHFCVQMMRPWHWEGLAIAETRVRPPERFSPGDYPVTVR